jgi:hypothetical protein
MNFLVWLVIGKSSPLADHSWGGNNFSGLRLLTLTLERFSGLA